MILRVNRNTQGRDFVVGDIHGCFHLVALALTHVHFDPERDRLFVVGDLIDRGPYSWQVWTFLQQPWVYSVMGNHEEMLLDIYAYSPAPTEVYQQVRNTDLAWWVDVPLSARTQILNALRDLPLVIEVETDVGLIGILHAEVATGYTSWPAFIKDLPESYMLRQSCLWGRDRARRQLQEPIEGVARVYAGHTIHDKPTPYGNTVIIDTGAFAYAENDPIGDYAITLVRLTADTRDFGLPYKGNGFTVIG